MTEAQVKKFVDKFGGKLDKKTKMYKIGICSEINIPKDYFKNPKVGRNTLNAILDRLVNAAADEGGKKAQWIRKNF